MARTGPRDADMGTGAAEESGRWALAGQSRRNRGGRCARGARCAVERGGDPPAIGAEERRRVVDRQTGPPRRRTRKPELRVNAHGRKDRDGVRELRLGG
jgi:hypothetical protein